jgi:hypothetical protein
MIDSIGLGGFLADVVIGFCLLISVGIFSFLLHKKNNFSWIWLSISFNAISFLYFIGDASDSLTITNVFIWPVINIILIIWYVRKK